MTAKPNTTEVMTRLQAAGEELIAAAAAAQAAGADEELAATINYALSLLGGAATIYCGEPLPAAQTLYAPPTPRPARARR